MRFSGVVLLAISVCGAAETTVNLPNATISANIPYDQHPKTVLDVIAPKDTGTGKRPGLIAIHGGGWTGGSKEQFLQRVLPFVEQGFVAANIEYRLADAGVAPTAVTDVLRAAEWFRKNGKRWNVDTDRLVVMGGSAGGHLALMVGLTPKSAKLGPTTDIAAVVNFYGITDVEDVIHGVNTRPWAVQWVPESPERLELARRVSPITYARKDVPAVLTLHGTADETVPYEHGFNLTKALRDAGADAEMISVPDGKHQFTKEQLDYSHQQIWEFLRRRGILK